MLLFLRLPPKFPWSPPRRRFSLEVLGCLMIKRIHAFPQLSVFLVSASVYALDSLFSSREFYVTEQQAHQTTEHASPSPGIAHSLKALHLAAILFLVDTISVQMSTELNLFPPLISSSVVVVFSLVERALFFSKRASSHLSPQRPFPSKLF